MTTSNPREDASSNPREDASVQSPIRLRDLLQRAVFVGTADIEVTRCVDRADKCRPGDVFVATVTAGGDGHDHVEEALARGAIAVVAERLLPVSAPQCLVENTLEAYAQVTQALVGQPSQRMLTIGIVGSHGKTTSSLFVAAMLKRLGGAVAYYTSLGASDSTHCDRQATRPPAAGKLAKWLSQADRAGCPAAIIELAPAMLAKRATAGIDFDIVIVSGMRPGQFRGSPAAKNLRRLVDQATTQLKPHGVVLYNADDPVVAQWAARTEVPAVGYGLDASEHIRGKRLSRMGGEQSILTIAGKMLMPMTLKIPGDHIARAALSAVATAWALEFSIPEAVAGIESLEAIPGRMQRLTQAVDVPLFIDAGETPDRIAVALHALRQHGYGPATVVVDLNSRTDPSWRERLGTVLEKEAQQVVLTASDLSPQAAQAMAMDVLGGTRSPGRIQIIPDREAAIAWAVNHTDDGCILLSGCGACNWITRDATPTSDERAAKAAVSQRNAAAPAPLLGIFPPPSSNYTIK